MNPRYYPHVTVLSGVLLLLLPFAAVFLANTPSTDSFDEDDVAAIVSSKLHPERSGKSAQIKNVHRSSPAPSVTVPPDQIVAAHDQSRLQAEFSVSNSFSEANSTVVDSRDETAPMNVVADASSLRADRSGAAMSGQLPPVPRVAMLDGGPAIVSDSFGGFGPPDELPPATGPFPESPPPDRPVILGTPLEAPPDAKASPADESAIPESVPVPTGLPSPFAATGQMAVPSAALGGTGSGVTSSKNSPSTSSGTSSDAARRRKKSSSSSDPRVPEPTVSASSPLPDPAGSNSAAPATPGALPSWVTGRSPVDVTPQTAVEDVILQHPLENSRVMQKENLVAVTNAAGWPVILVKSGIPGDDWWVQQMVGIRGNAFAAKVSFGNEESVPGITYRLVVVFLDSADEMRRFRISRQFKTLPEGLRRSREFTFVRQ
ncbi:MAG: hypothetical protein KDA89_19240 [Planctomycetaceae bacterium]|nr:hypothetical protein [Planctomycetaceae bacterium]